MMAMTFYYEGDDDDDDNDDDGAMTYSQKFMVLSKFSVLNVGAGKPPCKHFSKKINSGLFRKPWFSIVIYNTKLKFVFWRNP